MYADKRQMRKQQEIRQFKQQQGKELLLEKTKRLKEIHEQFSQNLQEFASQYKDEINKNPHFREKFNTLCQDLGVNPMLSSYSKENNLVRARVFIYYKNLSYFPYRFGDFYSELAIKVLDICAKKRSQNGGIMKIDDIISDYNKIQDIERSLKTIKDLGGCSIMQKKYVCTVPVALSDDFNEIMNIAEKNGYFSVELIKNNLHWDQERIDQKIDTLRKEGLVWIDKKVDGPAHYYFPSMLNNYINLINQ